MIASRIRDLPPLLRAWLPTRRLYFRGRGRIGAYLVRRLIEPSQPYRTAEGYVLGVDPRDPFQAWMLLGIYEPRLSEALASHATADSVALDIGSHIGYHALIMARGVGEGGEVHAFDPDPRAHELLRRHLDLNESRQVTANRAAASDRDGSVDLNVNEQLGWSSTKPVKTAPKVLSVPAVRVDSYLEARGIDPARVSVIKLDAESAELEALHGMRSLLTEGAPATIVEMIPSRAHQRTAEIVAFMRGLGYGSSPTDGGLVFAR